jgi:hypothetical protein
LFCFFVFAEKREKKERGENKNKKKINR